MTDRSAASGALTAVLEESKRLGLLGPGEVRRHIEHSLAFVELLEGLEGDAADLGAGGGVPGLVLATALPGLRWILVERSERRCSFLLWAIGALSLDAEVWAGSAEDLARTPSRGGFAVVTARSFGPPSVVAECAGPLLRAGGRLVVSEPPSDDDRWPADALAPFGLVPTRVVEGPPRLQVLEGNGACGVEFPRRAGVPERHPRF